MNDNLTDRNFWLNYWEEKNEIVKTEVKSQYLFSKAFNKSVKEIKPKSAVEIGGFPGFFAIYLKKYLNIPVTIFDYVIHIKIFEELLAYNGLNKDDIGVIEGDMFDYAIDKKYDFVYSVGLIEHFKDIQNIIKIHLQFCNEGKRVFIVLPNFRSINGYINKLFDRSHYDAHNIDCMDITYLREEAKKAGMKNISCYYQGKFSIWVEPDVKLNLFNKFFYKAIWFSGKILTKIFPFESKWFSPYIILEGDN